MLIKARMLGNAYVEVDGQLVEFPYKKTEALFYYLLLNKHASRDRIAGLLWGGQSDSDAKKNLRNAIYGLKHTILKDCIVAENRADLSLNPSAELELDVQDLMIFNMEIDEHHGEEFLSGFCLKNADEFEQWLSDKRIQFQQHFVDIMEHKIDDYLESKDYHRAEYYLKILITKDEFNEGCHRKLMNLYNDIGEVGKAVKVYETLAERLESVLGISPDPQTLDLIRRIENREMSRLSLQHVENGLVERTQEISQLQQWFVRGKNGTKNRSLIISGEAGIGKTALVNSFVKLVECETVLVLKSECYEAMEEHPFQAWQEIMDQIADSVDVGALKLSLLAEGTLQHFFPRITAYRENVPEVMPVGEHAKWLLLMESVRELLDKLAYGRRVLIVFEDIHWCDCKSLDLIISLQSGKNVSPVMFILTSLLGDSGRLRKLIISLSRMEKLEAIALNRLSHKGTAKLCEIDSPNIVMSQELLKNIFDETEGNPFFIIETLNLIKDGKSINGLSSSMQNILEGRLSPLSQDEDALVSLLSVFFDEVSYEVLSSIWGKNSNKLILCLEELKERSIIREIVGKKGDLTYRFNHPKLREFVYSRLSLSRARVLNNKVGLFLENYYQNILYDWHMVMRLIYYFDRSGNLIKKAEYLLKYLHFNFNIANELFPLLEDSMLENINESGICTDSPEKYFNDLESTLEEIRKSRGDLPEIRYMVRCYRSIRTNQLIWSGEYEKGLEMLGELLRSAEKDRDSRIIVSVFQQMCYYGIQIDDGALVQRYAERMQRACTEYDDRLGVATAMRFSGIGCILSKEFENAKTRLNKSVEMFYEMESCGEQYSIAIAAAYNFIGDIYSYNNQFDEALKYYQKSFNLCEVRRIAWGKDLILGNAAMAAFESGNKSLAKEYLLKAISLMNGISVGRGTVLVNCFMALILYYEGDRIKALQHLQKAETHSIQLRKKLWLGLVNRVKAEIRVGMDSKQAEKEMKFTETAKKYLDDAEAYFIEVGHQGELIVCSKIRKELVWL